MFNRKNKLKLVVIRVGSRSGNYSAIIENPLNYTTIHLGFSNRHSLQCCSLINGNVYNIFYERLFLHTLGLKERNNPLFILFLFILFSALISCFSAHHISLREVVPRTLGLCSGTTSFFILKHGTDK